MKKIVLTGGGTAGHITPNIALLPELEKLGYEAEYIGAKDSMEEKLMSPLMPYHTVSVGKLRRYFDIKNFSDPFRVIKGAFEARRLLKKLRPDAVFAKGGFVSVPVAAGAYSLGIPVVLHESDRSPGLANKICIPMCRHICTAFPETAQMLGEKAVCTGLPVRGTLLAGDRAKGFSLTGFAEGLPVLLVMGGSQGAKAINDALREALPVLTKEFQIVHLCGEGNLDPVCEGVSGYYQLEYADAQLPDLFAITDLVLSRAGATALFEFAALEKPVLAVPLPKGASRGDQIDNAEDFKKRGWLDVLFQEELTAETLTAALRNLWADRTAYHAALRKADMAGAVARVAREIDSAAKKKK